MANTPASDTATLATLYDDTRRTIPYHIDIRQAEEEFTRLQRQFTRHDTTDDQAQPSTPLSEHPKKDLEKASSDDPVPGELFDLREYLSSSNDANQAAGIKHKHVGVTWEDLQVTGIGGEDNKVRFPFHAVLFSSLSCPPPPSDLCPHIFGCNSRDRHVPRHAWMGSSFALAPPQVHACPPNTYDHS